MMSGRSAGAGGDSRHGYVLLLRCWGVAGRAACAGSGFAACRRGRWESS